jgi:hypothetical protein
MVDTHMHLQTCASNRHRADAQPSGSADVEGRSGSYSPLPAMSRSSRRNGDLPRADRVAGQLIVTGRGASAKDLRAAACSVGTTVEHRSAFGADQVQPTCGFSTLVGSRLGCRGHRRFVTPFAMIAINSFLPDMPRRGGGVELDLEADRAERVHLMLDVGRDRLGVAGSDLDFERRLARHGETQPPLVHHDPPPGACGEAVRTAEPARHGLLVPLGAEANETETAWGFGPVAQRTAEQSTEPGRPSGVVGHPSSELERRTVTDMLAVAAGELGDPGAFVVSVVAGDRSFHRHQPTSGSSNITGVHISPTSRRAWRGRGESGRGGPV